MPIQISFFKKLWQSKTFKWILGFFVAGVVGIFLIIKHNSATSYQFISVTQGPIIESVSLTGNTTPSQSVSLTFGSSGTISHTYSDLGQRVSSGQLLAELNTNDLLAQLHQAQANVDIQKAKLVSLQAGSRPEDIAASQAALDKSKQDLANMYGSMQDASTDSYNKANDAVRTQLEQFFTGGETQNPKLTYFSSGSISSQAQGDAEAERYLASIALNKWQAQLSSSNTSNDSMQALLTNEVAYLVTIRQLLSNVSITLNDNNAPNLSVSTLSTYKADLSIALNEVNLATTNLNTLSQNIASQGLTVSQLQAQLDLKKAGALPSDISAQEAQVEQAQASVSSANAKLQNAQIVSPISGTVTQFDAKVGQLASMNTPLVSIMSSGGYEVDAGVSEIDVGKISIGNKVTMTLDAFPNETLTGLVFYIAPAETNKGGVISYLTKISFDKLDARLKSGLTANIDIQTKFKDNVLILPEYAILQNDQGTFVETLVNNTVKQNSVVLGIQDEKGNVEVVSGVTAGEKVLNIGLKS
jgi:HlyD family secretion protein